MDGIITISDLTSIFKSKTNDVILETVDHKDLIIKQEVLLACINENSPLIYAIKEIKDENNRITVSYHSSIVSLFIDFVHFDYKMTLNF